MKKLLILTAAICICACSFSQTGKNIEIGLDVGYNAATVSTGNQTNSEYRSGFNAAFLMEYYFSDRWGIKGKLLYDQKGWNNGYLSFENNGESFYTNYKLDYITVPVMANWHFGKKRNWYLNFGPYIGFLLNASESAGGTDLKPLFKKIDAGLAYGIGVKFPIAPNAKLFLELDDQSGIANIVNSTDGSSLHSNRGSFNIGVNFLLK